MLFFDSSLKMCNLNKISIKKSKVFFAFIEKEGSSNEFNILFTSIL